MLVTRAFPPEKPEALNRLERGVDGLRKLQSSGRCLVCRSLPLTRTACARVVDCEQGVSRYVFTTAISASTAATEKRLELALPFLHARVDIGRAAGTPAPRIALPAWLIPRHNFFSLDPSFRRGKPYLYARRTRKPRELHIG